MKLIFYSFIFFYSISICLNYIVYPLEISEELDKIENLLLFDSTYTTLQMGNPPQKVNFYFSVNHSKMYISDIGCKNFNLYNIQNSKTVNILGEIEKDNQTNISKILLMEQLIFNDDINLTKTFKLENFPLYYYSNLEKIKFNLCGNIGLSIIQLESNSKEHDEFENYLYYLKSQIYSFSFFNYNGKDYIVNSIYLHQEFKDMFKEIKNISLVNPTVRGSSLNWEISMKEIYYNNIHIKDNNIMELNPLFELIIGNDIYYINIRNDFFNLYINKKICFSNEVNGYKVYECDADKFDFNDIKKFPTLYMLNNEINFIFEMNGEELFIKLNNKYYFKIVFPIKKLESNKWILGKIFLRKYPTMFSPSKKLIGFYLKSNENLSEKKNNKVSGQIESNKKIFLLLLIIGISLIFIFLCLYIGKKMFFPKRKNKNKLIDDYYKYNSEGNNDNINKGNNHNNLDNSIEMDNK